VSRRKDSEPSDTVNFVVGCVAVGGTVVAVACMVALAMQAILT
jgi:hypothetical protein